jgi:adenylate cyclase
VLSPVRDFNSIQSRVRETLDKGVQIDLSTESCNRFLRRHVNAKIGVVILYVDIDGSTKMSMSLPSSKFATILQIFSQEMSMLVSEYGGYTLKYVGDAIIALFPAEFDPRRASINAVNCARDIQQVIKRSINPEFKSHGLPEIMVRTALDYGEVLVVLYGRSIERSHIDILGITINMAAKMLPLVKTGQTMVGNSLYENLTAGGAPPEDFVEFDPSNSNWSYIDEKTGRRYRLHLIK